MQGHLTFADVVLSRVAERKLPKKVAQLAVLVGLELCGPVMAPASRRFADACIDEALRRSW